MFALRMKRDMINKREIATFLENEEKRELI